MKTEPSTYSINDLEKDKVEHWDGIRNYQARNFMRDDMKIGDKILIYHSNTKEIGVVGVAEVFSEAYPDHTQFDPNSKYFDPKSREENPRWIMVDVKFVEKFNNVILLKTLKEIPELSEMRLLQKGNRLSILPVKKKEFDIISSLKK
jgi:predicted RNA-binding protein with PUA-like domain